jgi:hypothetical protein
VDRRRLALFALLAFAVATAVAIVVSGSRSHTGQGVAPMVVQGVGHAFALVAALALLAPGDVFGPPAGADRKLGGVVLAALVVLVLLDAFADAAGGANIGAGFLRLICLVVIVAVAGRLMSTTVALGRRRPGL